MKRDKVEITRKILLICKNSGIRKTRIVYQANLNFRNTEIYLKRLINQELIIKEGNCFKIAPKGVELLSNLQNVSSILNLK